MKCTKIILSGLMALAATANAMPTPEETKKVEPLVADLLRNDQAALKSGKKTRVEVAESAMALAEQADSEAAKMLLTKGAFNLYVRAGEFDKAIETLQSLQEAIPDIPPTNMVKIIESSLRAVPRKNGGQLYRLLGEIKTRIRYTDEVKTLEKSIKKNPADRALRLKIAEHYAYLGDWDLALENFAAVDGKIGEIAKAERDGNGGTKTVADFWWEYPKGYAKGKTEEIEKCFHVHAARLYEEAIASDDIKGLNKVQAERRIEEAKEYGDYDMSPSKAGKSGGKDLYMIVDLTKTGKSAISYLNDVPKNGWSDEYKTKKIVFRRIEPGSFEYLPGKSFKITKPFYIGAFEVTQKQYEMVMKENPSEFKGDMRPVERVSYLDIRGMNKGLNWPKDNKVDDNAYLGKLRKRIGLEFDLPTEVQWEYACRAGTKGDFNVNGVEMVKLGKGRDNGGLNDHHVKVGSFLPNAWGIYDMHGNLWEWCVDRSKDARTGYYEFFGWESESKETETDPMGLAAGSSRFVRGGSWVHAPANCRSSFRCRVNPGVRGGDTGFRLACPAEAGQVEVVAQETAIDNVERQRQIAQQQFVKERAIYGNAARKEIENLYQEFSKTHDLATMRKLADKYPLANRTGCAILYAADYAPGAKREELLKMAIEKFDGCYYGDGARVGVLARVILASLYNGTNRTNEGRALWREVAEKYPDAIDHRGNKVVDSMPDWAK